MWRLTGDGAGRRERQSSAGSWATSREAGRAPPVFQDEHHAQGVEAAVLLEQRCPTLANGGVVLVFAVHHLLVGLHGTGALLHLLQLSVDFDKRQSVVRVVCRL